MSPAKFLVLIFFKHYHKVKNMFFESDDKKLSYKRFHSQFGEDRFIYENLDIPVKGVFVDIGAGHPYKESNTYFFERNGWEGLCIDADPDQFKLLKKHRLNSVWTVISTQQGSVKFQKSYLNSYSSMLNERFRKIFKLIVKEVIDVPSSTLQSVLKDHNIKKIDILDIDVEGSELDVWDSFDYKTYLPKIVIIEYLTFGFNDNSIMIIEHFKNLPYKLIHKTPTNLIFANIE